MNEKKYGVTLRSLIEQYGCPGPESIPRFKSLLQDYFVESPQDLKLLIAGLEEGIPSQLVIQKGKIPYDMISSQLISRMETERGMNKDVAEWVVRTWAEAVGYSTIKSSSHIGVQGNDVSRHEPTLHYAQETHLKQEKEGINRKKDEKHPYQDGDKSGRPVGLIVLSIFIVGLCSIFFLFLSLSPIEQDYKKIWEFQAGTQILTALEFSEDIIYAGSNDKNLYVLDIADGNKLWEFSTGDWVSKPTVVDGVVYFGSRDAKLYALNAADGKKIWEFTTEGEIYDAPAVDNGVIFVGSSDGKLHALNADNGKEIWAYNAGGGISSPPIVDRNVVYVGGGNVLYALDASYGKVIWEFPTSDSIAGVVIANNLLYMSNWNSKVYALFFTIQY